MEIFAVGDLKRYKKIFQRTARKYPEHMNHRSLMTGKLSDLLVIIGSDDENVSANGIVELNYIDNHVVHRMNIRINPNDSDKQIARVMAHELAHILFAFTYNYFCYGSESKSGCKAVKSSFVRINTATKEEFGIGLEEGAAEALAGYIVSHCRFSDSEAAHTQESTRELYYSMLVELTEALANCFGKPLYSSKYIDGLTVEKFIVEKDHPLYEKLEDTYDDDLWVTNRKFFKYSEANLFWYSAVTNTFHCTIDEYDKYMGKGAFHNLCRHFDGLYMQYMEHADEDGAYDIALDHKCKAMEMIRKFDEIYKSRPAGQLDEPEAMYKQYEEQYTATAAGN